MKIAMIGHKRIPGREGGIEVVVEELSVRMAALGHKVCAYNRKTKRRQERSEYKSVRIITVPTIEKKSTDAVVYSFLATIHALFGKYDVIHYHALGPSAMLFIPHLFHIPTVVTVHGLNYKTPKWRGFGEKYIYWGEKITAKYADEIIVLSKKQKEYFKKKYHRETTYIPNGITMDTLLAPKIIKERWGLEKWGYILMVSRIVPGKGIEHLVEAYKRIDTKLPLVLAGESRFAEKYYEELKEQIAGDGRIIMVGFISGDVLKEMYSNAALFVFPSEAEGMPLSLLEALSYNVPCLVSDIPENLEVAQDYAQSFRAGDIDDLEEQLKNCLAHRGELFVRESRSYIRENYNWDNVVGKTLKCYEESMKK